MQTFCSALGCGKESLVYLIPNKIKLIPIESKILVFFQQFKVPTSNFVAFSNWFLHSSTDYISLGKL